MSWVSDYQILLCCLLFKGNGKNVWHKGIWNEALDYHCMPRTHLLEILCVSVKNKTQSYLEVNGLKLKRIDGKWIFLGNKLMFATICYYYYSTIGKILFIYFLCLSHFLQAACQSAITMLLCQCIIGQTFKATHARFSYIKNHLLEEEIPFWLYGNAQRSQMWMWQIAVSQSIRNHKDLSIVYWILNRSWKVKASMVYVLYNKHF